ncbi:MAG: hypothetical protein OXL40_10115 [Bacteroidota bacterium]|nr:hypothetical protein [Bacteroidota bacterium]
MTDKSQNNPDPLFCYRIILKRKKPGPSDYILLVREQWYEWLKAISKHLIELTSDINWSEWILEAQTRGFESISSETVERINYIHDNEGSDEVPNKDLPHLVDLWCTHIVKRLKNVDVLKETIPVEISRLGYSVSFDNMLCKCTIHPTGKFTSDFDFEELRVQVFQNLRKKYPENHFGMPEFLEAWNDSLESLAQDE